MPVRIDFDILCVDTKFRTSADHELVTARRYLGLVVAIYIESIPFPGGPELEPAPYRDLPGAISETRHHQGLFAGASLEGAVIARRQDWNRAFYKEGATPHAIVIERAHANPAADALREALSRF